MRALRRRPALLCLALLALAMQAALAFAQTHAHTYALAGAEGLAKRAITYGMCRAKAERPCLPQAPHDDHAKCSICCSMSPTSAAVLDAPQAMPLWHPQIETPTPARTAARALGVSTVHFQARAPPIA